MIIREFLESARDDTPYYRGFIREQDEREIEMCRPWMQGTFTVDFGDELLGLTEHTVDYQSGLRVNIAVFGQDGQVLDVIFKPQGCPGRCTAPESRVDGATYTRRLEAGRSEYLELVEMLTADYKAARVVEIMQDAILTKSRAILPKKNGRWRKRWPISQERWERYSSLIAELDPLTRARLFDPPAGPVLFELHEDTFLSSSHSSGLAYSIAPFTDEERTFMSIEFAPISDRWATYERFTW